MQVDGGVLPERLSNKFVKKRRLASRLLSTFLLLTILHFPLAGGVLAAEAYTSESAPSKLTGSKLLASNLPTVLAEPTTYCNPLNLDYAYTPNKDYSVNNCHRSTADPVCALYKGKYYLFSTNQEGYWWSDNLLTWHFISHFFKENSSADQVCAPALWATDKGLLFLPCFNPKDTMPLYRSAEPLANKWEEATDSFPVKTWDPSLFEDDDQRLYVYWGSSNVYPIRGAELDPENQFKLKGPIHDFFTLHPQIHGWEQFGEDNQHGTMDPFVEGAWMNKFGSKYYLQYGAPGTEFNVYGDGVYTSDHPLGPFTYQSFNPFSWKPTGFICGAGHGATFVDKFDNKWHIATNVIALKYKFERRLGLFPAGVDKDGVLFADTSFGDYPHRAPQTKTDPGSTFTNWMLLSYKKKAWSSPSESNPELAFDEDIKTYWTAPDGKSGHFLAVDLGTPCNINAIQVNFADEKAKLYNKQLNIHHRYQIFESNDGKDWNLLVDKSKNEKDVPHDYIEFSSAVKTRFLKIVNIEMPTGSFAIGDLRVFGSAPGEKPGLVKGFAVSRDPKDKRNCSLTWQTVPGAYAYNIAFGTAPDKLYGSFLVYDKNSYDLHSLNTDSNYYFTVQSVAETGVSPAGSVVQVN
ncbi:MAG: xylosidase [Candidatus Melainabacteria bacterium]|nr:MAG: xylosidase [Candidatus Melainabacteria bacterium]